MAYKNIENFLKMLRENNEGKPWEYEFENEWTTNGFNLKKPIDRFFIFKATDKNNQTGHVKELKETEEFCKKCFSKYGDIADFDRCKLSIDLYKKLWGLENRTGTYYPINNPDFNTLFGGDTMNSVLIPLSNLLENLCQGEEGRKYEEQRKYTKDNGEGRKIQYTSIMYSLKLYQKYNEEFVTDICKKASGFEEFVRDYHTLGNFVLVPEGFNKQRGMSKKINDYWDLSLKYLKEYLQENGYSDNPELYFTKYINYFFLWDYVEKKNGEYEAKPIGMNNFSEKRDILKFIEESTENIKRRGKFMTAMLNIQLEKNELYKNIQEYLTGGKFWADSIFDAAKQILEQFNGKIPESAEMLLSELKEGKV